MHTHLKLLIITLGGLFFKWVIMKWAVNQGVDVLDLLIKKYLGKYPEELAIWIHFKKKRELHGHQFPNPLRCDDEACRLIQPRK